MVMRMQGTFSMLLACMFLAQIVSTLPAVEPAKPPAPVAKWTFDKESKEKALGVVRFDGDGPRSPVYPGFAADNRALVLDSPAWLSIADDKEESRFDFDNGDAITLEAWVKPASFTGQHVYIISKGRTEASGAKGINQNWALRLRKQKGLTALNFLFRSRADAQMPGDWHRWTSTTGLTAGSRWHHIAISYQFGKPESIRGYLDGKQVKGKWDMGGATTRPPVVDNDEVRIGSAYGGLRTVSFHGSLDDIAIHRRIVPAEELKSRFQWDPPKQEPPRIPRGKVVVQLFGPINSTAEFPRYLESPLYQWQQQEVAFIRLPHKYDSWGVREDWGQTVLMKAWSEIELPA
ncbi:MAG TPA: LamG domain-containing protein, partial [Planctomycetes bacterium]|nr:LamG domain-containing protein [Planctomycetota bacterium]